MARAGDFFMVGGQVIGFFRGGTLPTSDGVYFYEPYRGYGHYSFWKALASSGMLRCFYESGGQRVWFSVQAGPTHRQLSLAGFEIEQQTGEGKFPPARAT